MIKNVIRCLVLIVIVLLMVGNIVYSVTVPSPDVEPAPISSSSSVVVIGFLKWGIIGLVLIGIYLVPTVIACVKHHPEKLTIILINIFLGWSMIGWVGSLIWACILPKEEHKSNIYEDLAKLEELKNNGTISEVEFEVEKSKLLR